MLRASLLVFLLYLTGCCIESAGQLNQAASASQNRTANDEHVVELPPGQRTFSPRLPMQDALKIAEDYIGKQRIDISSYWLYRAQYILMGNENAAYKDKVPGWHFWWVSNTTATGDYVEIFVRMDGSVFRLASM
jgi:hypothetical protein